MLIANTRICGIGSLSVKNTYDADALAYLTAVEAADGQALENSVKIAINTFVVGCKTDGIWDAIVGCCIMAGARTYTGALVPLKGIAPINYNFASGDYSRKLGLLGNDSNKVLDTNYTHNEATLYSQDDNHLSVYITQLPTDLSGQIIGTTFQTGNLSYIRNGITGSTPTISFTSMTPTTTTRTLSIASLSTGFFGLTRNNSSNFISIATTNGGASEATTTGTSQSPESLKLGVFGSFSAGSPTTPTQPTSARMSFYSLGKSLTLSSLNSRITTLMTTLNALL
jgi:hypothetical protein